MSNFASQNLTIGQVNAIVKKLGGQEGALRFLRGSRTVKIFDFKVFKTIQLGVKIKDGEGFMQAFKDRGIGHRPALEWVLFNDPNFSVAKNPISVDLVCVGITDVGCISGDSYAEFFKAALRLGLKPCPLEVGPQLRLQYLDQPLDESLSIVTQGYFDHCHCPQVLDVRCRTWQNKDLPEFDVFPRGYSCPIEDDERYIFILPRR